MEYEESYPRNVIGASEREVAERLNSNIKKAWYELVAKVAFLISILMAMRQLRATFLQPQYS